MRPQAVRSALSCGVGSNSAACGPELSVELEASGLSRFRLSGPIGEGADCQVFAATDLEDGSPVVIKRPHPALIARGQHTDVEGRLLRSISFQQVLGRASRHLAGVVAHCAVEPGTGYFGDSHDRPYMVVVERRAVGVPLAGSAVDGIRRMPIGLPQQLFALHPVRGHPYRPRFCVALDVLEVGGAFLERGLVLLDARPQNVFFDPKKASITLIDTGGATQAREATRRRPALDAHDFYAELLKWYVPLGDPPADTDGYAASHGMDSVPRFEQDLAAFKRAYESMPWRNIGERGAAIIERVREREYSHPPDFRADFELLVALYEERYESLAGDAASAAVWTEASRMLDLPYWRKFLFDPGADMTAYRADADG